MKKILMFDRMADL